MANKIAIIGLAVAVVALGLTIGYSPFRSTLDHNHDEDYSANLYNFVAPTEYHGQTRTYYIASDEVNWNYAPTGKNMMTGASLSDDPTASVYTIGGNDRIGSTYLKCLYRAYSDSTFTKKQPENDNWSHLGILGPVIRAEVGDTIKVVFKNNCRIPTSMHPHGVFYEKSSEGAPYNDGIAISDKPGDIIQPGKTYTYTWNVPLRAGPGPHDPSSIVWMYHSHVDEVGDSYAGLVGPIIITKHGQTLLMDGMRTDMVELLPMSMKVLDMYPDNTGTWMYHCHVNDHISAGMMSLFTVTP